MNIYADLCSDFWSGYAIPNPIICVIFLTRRRGPNTPVGPCALHNVHNRLNQLVQKIMSISPQPKHAFQRQIQHSTFSGSKREAGCAVMKKVRKHALHIKAQSTLICEWKHDRLTSAGRASLRSRCASSAIAWVSLAFWPACVSSLWTITLVSSATFYTHARTHARTHTHTHTHSAHFTTSSKHFSVLRTVVFHPCCRHDIQTTAAVFYFTSSGRSARISVYSRQAGFSGFWCHRL